MKKWTRRFFSLLMTVALICGVAAMGAVQAGAASTKDSLGVYKELSSATKNAYMKTSDFEGNWDWVWPIDGVPKLSGCYVDFAMRSSSYIHYSLDFTGATEIVAAYEGIVVDAKNSNGNSGLGTYIVLEHTYNGQTFRSQYGHMEYNSIPKAVFEKKYIEDKNDPQKKVYAGDKLGIMGKTGDTNETHLHFSIWEGTKALKKWDGKASTKDASVVVDPFLNHFLPVPDTMVNGKNYTGNKYTGSGSDLSKKPNKTSWCCYYYLDAVKWEWDSRDLKFSKPDVGGSSLKFSWNAVPNASGYGIFKNSMPVTVLGKNATSYNATGLKAGTKYNFIVVALNSDGKAIKTLNASYTIPPKAGTPKATAPIATKPNPTTAKQNAATIPTAKAPAQSINIVSATPSRTSGTTADRYTYTVTTNIPATKIEYVFSGNARVYYINSNGTNNFGAGGYSISADKKTWVWRDDILAAGNPRTVTVTAYNGNQKTSKSFNIVVVSPSVTTAAATRPTTTATPQPHITILSAVPSRTSGTTKDKYSYTITTNAPATKLEFVFSGNARIYYINSDGTNNINSGKVKISNGGKTWQWVDDTLGAGNPRTVTVTAYNGTQTSTSRSFNIVVK